MALNRQYTMIEAIKSPRNDRGLILLERVKGVEPSDGVNRMPGWKPGALPIGDTRMGALNGG